MTLVFEIVKPIVLRWLVSERARIVLVEVLEKLAAKTDNEVDDALVAGLRRALHVED